MPFQPKPQMVLAWLEQARAWGVPYGGVVAEADYGDTSKVLAGLESWRQRYVVRKGLCMMKQWRYGMRQKRFSGVILPLLLTACAAYVTPEGTYIAPLPAAVVVGPPVVVAPPPAVVVRPLPPVVVVPERHVYFYDNLYYYHWEGSWYYSPGERGPWHRLPRHYYPPRYRHGH